MKVHFGITLSLFLFILILIWIFQDPKIRCILYVIEYQLFVPVFLFFFSLEKDNYEPWN